MPKEAQITITLITITLEDITAGRKLLWRLRSL